MAENVSESAGGRAVLVTGAAQGIGWAIAKRFAAAGDRVAILDKQPARDELVDALDGSGHTAVEVDLRDSAAVPAAVDSAVDRLGGMDVLVNDAGIFTAHPITEVSYETWQEHWRDTLGVNLVGAANVTWCAVQHMKRQGRGGRVVNVTSRGAFRGEPDHPAYGASKAGLNSLTQSLAIALAPHRIAVSAVAPGFVVTDLTTDMLAAPGGDQIRAQSPFGRVAQPDEIAAAVHYLASAQAEWTSGAILDLNGASYLRS